ncbi:ABC transporter substrate-binding protein [Paenibacillus abyssi]|uniref:ABC transporter substrate-binding protein n=1 Tax=Paenibacillus abyssi TaxID=1340531 RepID=A0A917G769_9BACL|nr:ABC transporter substrate-binding protein [Paenibacillus abyssi]GGG25600.1 ABC transporter substrate-binding protein [Paenibacillus abyssi]
MNAKKMSVTLLAVILSVAIVFAGCSNSQQSGGSTDASGKTTITFWHAMTDVTAEAVEAVIADFEAKHPDINIEPTYIANQGEGQNEKLLAAIAGGNPPDVAYFDRFEVGAWAAQGSLEELTEFAAADGINQDMYYPFAWNESSYQGKLYAVPTTTDSRLVYYNIDHFTEAGLDPNNPPSTIAELEAAAEQLTKKDGKRFERIGFIPWYGQGWLYGWGWAFGGDFYDPETNQATANDPKNVEALQWIADFAQKYNVEDIAAFTDSQGTGAMDPFLSGQLSMKVSGPWEVSAIEKFMPDLNYGVFPMPTPTGTDHTTWSGGWSVVIPKGAKNKEAAWEFLKYFGSANGQKIFSDISKDFSVIDSVNEELGFKEDPILKQFVDILPVSNNRPVMTQGSLYWNELAGAVENATRGNGTPQEILDQVTQKVNNELAKE